MLKIRLNLAAAIVVALAVAAPVALAQSEMTIAISLMFQDPSDPTHGTSYENEAERYGRSVTVNYTGKEGDSVERGVKRRSSTRWPILNARQAPDNENGT